MSRLKTKNPFLAKTPFNDVGDKPMLLPVPEAPVTHERMARRARPAAEGDAPPPKRRSPQPAAPLLAPTAVL